MRTLNVAAAHLLSCVLLLFIAAGGNTPTLLLAGLAVGAVISTVALGMLAAQCIAVLVNASGGRSHARDWQHRQALRAQPAPQHPDTDGRPRTRAPSRVASAA